MPVRNMKSVGGIVCAFLAVLIGVSCTSKQYQAERLDKQIGTATQNEIGLLLGQPDAVRDLPNGETEWTYQYRRTSAGGTAVVGTSICYRIVLRFDQDGVLRERRRESC